MLDLLMMETFCIDCQLFHRALSPMLSRSKHASTTMSFKTANELLGTSASMCLSA